MWFCVPVIEIENYLRMGPKYVIINLPNHRVYFHLCISLLSPVFSDSWSCWRIKLRWLSAGH